MDDGKEAVAKIPYPNAGPHLTTASEVATMDFARSILKAPVPKVFLWSSHAQDNPVGADFIIMEKPKGVPLISVWDKMNTTDRLLFTKSFVGYQKDCMSASFDDYGSLYYTQDLQEHASRPHCSGPINEETQKPKFSVGPTIGLKWWCFEGKIAVDFDKGPWSSAEEYLTAIGLREMACVKALTRLPSSLFTICGPHTYQPTHEKKTRALQHYLNIVKAIAPTDPTCQRSCLMLDEFYDESIFVDPENPTRVTAITDWSSMEVAPMFINVGLPQFLEDGGPPVEGPSLIPDFAQLPRKERSQAKALFIERSLCELYPILLRHYNPEASKCLEFRGTDVFKLLASAQIILQYSNPDIMRLVDISADEREQTDIDVEKLSSGRGGMEEMKVTLGNLFPVRNLIVPRRYDETKEALRQYRQWFIAEHSDTEEEKTEWLESWPFDD